MCTFEVVVIPGTGRSVPAIIYRVCPAIHYVLSTAASSGPPKTRSADRQQHLSGLDHLCVWVWVWVCGCAYACSRACVCDCAD